MGWLIPNDLPTGKKANTGVHIDLTKEVSHCGTVDVGQERVGETSAVNRQGPFFFFA